ncbi:MAG: serine/threonine protein kinase [Myxococcota bacterium]
MFRALLGPKSALLGICYYASISPRFYMNLPPRRIPTTMAMENEVVEGQVLAGKYRVERVLGKGGMGVVVAAQHLVLDELVAMKFLLPEALASGEAVARFEREARAAVKIKSEHVVRVTDVGRLESGAPYMVMEYLNGEDLATWLRERGALPIDLAVDFVLQACVAVADAHSVGIIHRDLKPGNLFCVRRSDGQLLIKVLDFGISKLSDVATGAAAMTVTKTAAIMGSPLYMSPEQVQSSKDVDARSDIWALGVVLFQLLTGAVPFNGEAFGEVAIKIATHPTPSVCGLRADVPAGLELVLNRCLEKQREQRYPNVAELALALLPFAPRRSRATVERVLGIVQASGVATSEVSALSLRESTSHEFAPRTDAPWSGSTHPSATRGVGRTLAITAGLLLCLAVVAAVGFGLRTLKPNEFAASAAPVVPSLQPAEVASVPAPARSAEVALQGSEVSTSSSSAAASAEPIIELAPAPARNQTAKPKPADVPIVKPAPPRASAQRPECDPPYTLDERGRKKFKPECFLNPK